MSDETAILGDVRLEFEQFGSGPTILFLHGEDGLLWSRPLLNELASRYHVVAPHHPGWGGSTRPEFVRDVRDLAAVYDEFLGQLDGPVHLLGCSFGGWIAAELAILRPTRLGAVVLAAPTGVKLGGREDRDFADIWAASYSEIPSILYGDPSAAPNLGDAADEDFLYLAVAQEATARYCWSPYMHDPRLRYWLRRIERPALIVAGGRDRFALLPDYYRDYAALAGAELRLLPEVGHRIEEEAPAELARISEAFFDEAALSSSCETSGVS